MLTLSFHPKECLPDGEDVGFLACQLPIFFPSEAVAYCSGLFLRGKTKL